MRVADVSARASAGLTSAGPSRAAAGRLLGLLPFQLAKLGLALEDGALEPGHSLPRLAALHHVLVDTREPGDVTAQGRDVRSSDNHASGLPGLTRFTPTVGGPDASPRNTSDTLGPAETPKHRRCAWAGFRSGAVAQPVRAEDS
jgi:hypothetical protein